MTSTSHSPNVGPREPPYSSLSAQFQELYFPLNSDCCGPASWVTQVRSLECRSHSRALRFSLKRYFSESIFTVGNGCLRALICSQAPWSQSAACSQASLSSLRMRG